MDYKLLNEYKFLDTSELKDSYSHSNEQNGAMFLLNYLLNNDD